MRQENIDSVKSLLDRWANYIGEHGGALGDGAPRQCPMAPDARVQSIEDLEIEVERFIVNAVHTAIWDLPRELREVIEIHYGFCGKAWTLGHDETFQKAIEAMFKLLCEKIVV